MSLTGLSLAATALPAQTQNCPVTQGAEMPLKFAGSPTVAQITACDLMTRLYIYADDSMMGRRVGTEDNLRATSYLANEAGKMGLKPAGDAGTFFQYIGIWSSRTLARTSAIMVNGQTFEGERDFNLTFPAAAKTMNNMGVIYGGVAGDTLNPLTPAQVHGKILVLSPAPAAAGGQGGFAGGRGGFAGGRGAFGGGSPTQAAIARTQQAAAIVLTLVGDQLATANSAQGGRGGRGGAGRGTFIEFTSDTLQATGTGINAMALAFFGKPLSEVTKGTEGKTANVSLQMDQIRVPARNVVALLEGSDPKLKNEYILLSAHNDHNGYNNNPVADHDSIRMVLKYGAPLGADDQARSWAQRDARIQASPALQAAFRKSLDSIRALRPTPRADSIQNGADDDGSGSVTLLEVAEYFAKGTVKPKRSILFVWQTGEESGMQGSGWYATHPTVPRENIVANLNMDMVGRGFANDATAAIVEPDANGRLVVTEKTMFGGPGYLQLVGSRRLSKEYGDLVETVNKEGKFGFKFDYSLDANGHPQNIYCRSDHWSYAKYGIPTVFLTTGLHADYHQVTDEPQYINYLHMAEVGKFAAALTLRVADLDHRVKVDLPGPFDPTARCQQ